MITTRRELLSGAAAVGTTFAIPALAQGKPDAGTAGTLLDRIAEELLVEYPESAASLGIDKGPRAALRHRFEDRSGAAEQRRATLCRDRLAQLRATSRTGLSHEAALDLDVCQSAYELADAGYRTMPLGDVATLGYSSYRSTPYVVSQNTGAYVELPDILENHHDVANAEDAGAYLDRLQSFAAAVDGETGRLAADQAKGAILPGFLNDIAVKQLAGMRDQPAAQWSVVESFRAKCAKAGLPTRYAEQAEQIAKMRIAPAFGRQIAAFQAARPKATDVPGVWARPNGDAYYSWLVKAGTTTDYAPDELHRMGVEQSAKLNAQIDTLLKQQGLTQGTVGERLTALSKRPDLLFSNDEAGRQKLLAYLNGRIADIRTRLPRAFATLVKGNLVIKRVPPAIQDGMPDGYAGPGSIDGSTPGIYYINLKSTENWPRYSLPTLCYHEGIPGHVWQGEYTFKMPLIRTLLAFNAYSEGWALYSEQLGDELGAYADDPLGRIGYLQSINFRAVRLIVDTGIHAKRWTFDQALDTFAAGTGQPREQLRAELNRYCSWPGQACGYKMGHNQINTLRLKAQSELGSRFDLRTFDDAIVLGGNMSLTLLARVVDRYIAAQHA
jgi:uncharacterized protein (DUF885 family)